MLSNKRYWRELWCAGTHTLSVMWQSEGFALSRIAAMNRYALHGSHDWFW
jgi:hypothetical protein